MPELTPLEAAIVGKITGLTAVLMATISALQTVGAFPTEPWAKMLRELSPRFEIEGDANAAPHTVNLINQFLGAFDPEHPQSPSEQGPSWLRAVIRGGKS